MDWESIMLSEINQRKTNTIQYHLYVESKKIQKTSEYNKKEIHPLIYAENKVMVTRGEWGEKQYRSEGGRGENYWM